MTNKTTQHMNTLLDQSRPTVPPAIDAESIRPYATNCFAVARDVQANRKAFESIILAHMDAAIAEEIRASAAGRTKAVIGTVQVWGEDIIHFSLNGNAVCRAWRMAYPALVAHFAASDKAALDRYEAYRIACAQGVAVPPVS